MFCKKCGAQVTNGTAKFPTSCGAHLPAVDVAEAHLVDEAKKDLATKIASRL